MPVRWYHGTFALAGQRVRLPTAAGCPPLWLRLDRAIPYPVERVRSVTLVAEGGRLWLEVTAELPVATYPDGQAPHPGRVAGVDLGIIHPYAVAGPDGQALLVSGRAIRAEHRLHLAGITVHLVDERGTSSTCPQCRHRITKPRGRVLTCPHCATSGHRDLLAAATIATRTPGGAPTTNDSPIQLPQVITHRRAGRHLPGVASARRDPRRPDQGTAKRVGWPAVARPTTSVGSRSTTPCGEDPQHHQTR
jgi:hypothetical protein